VRAPAIATLGIAAFAVFLVATAPASFVAAEVERRAAGQVEFLETSGTLWNGRARARVATPGGPFLVERIEWHFLPARLAAGRVAFNVDVGANGIDANASVGRGFTDWEIGALKAKVQAATLTAILPLLATWRPEGAIDVASPGITWKDGEARGSANLEWRDAAVSLTGVKPMGTYRLEARGEGGPAKVKVTTLSGPLRISAQGELSASRAALSGEARGEGDSAKALEPLLDLFGPRRADGARSLDIRLN
jgi:general secretion pathway protein N